MFPWVLSCWNAGIPYSFSCKLGGFFVNFLLEAAPFASVFEKLTLLTFTAPVCAEQEQRRGNDFHAGRAPALDSSCLGVAGFPGLGVTKVLFLSTVQSRDYHPSWEPGTAGLSPEVPRERSCNFVLLDIS